MAAFSTDSRRLLVGTAGGKTVVLDFSPSGSVWDRKHELAVGDDPITSCALSSDGRLAFAFAADGSNKLWDLSKSDPAAGAVALPFEQWRPKQRAPGAHAEVTHATFSPDGRYLATSTSQGVFLWDLDLDSLLDKACKATGRNLTCSEWKDAFGEEPYRRTCPDLPGPWDAADPESKAPCARLYEPHEAG